MPQKPLLECSVLSFGAKGDGKTDDTKAIQKALNACRKTGGIIRFPDGEYLISACLILYSKQTLSFSEKAVLKRNSDVKYMIAVHTLPFVGKYNGTHDVVIRGGTFDGNEEIAMKVTMINTCHAKNVLIENCSFKNGREWHFIELNSTQNAVVRNCRFDATNYIIRDTGRSELIQIDVPKVGLYGPVLRHGVEMPFFPDRTPCENVKIQHCFFLCAGTPALGQHSDYPHHDIRFFDNEVVGTSSTVKASRGYLVFMEKTYDVEVCGNRFTSTVETENTGVRVALEKTVCHLHDNTFVGHFEPLFVGGVTAEKNDFERETQRQKTAQ